MSVQSDCESLYINVVEEYRLKNNMSIESTYRLFQSCHVFEKILLQHEYLHQICFEEVFEYVEEIIYTSDKELVLYHGTCFDFDKIDLNYSKNRRDFGKGFYTTVLYSQAKEWAYRLSLRSNRSEYYINVYTFKENDNLKIKYFDSLNEEWLEFIKNNRLKGGLQHQYDVVIGPVADDNTMQTVQLYMSNILTAKEAVERLKYSKANKQVSFHTQKSLEELIFLRKETYHE